MNDPETPKPFDPAKFTHMERLPDGTFRPTEEKTDFLYSPLVMEFGPSILRPAYGPWLAKQAAFDVLVDHGKLFGDPEKDR